jgi:hypothetical protein
LRRKSAQERKTEPRGLKPESFCSSYGTAEAVPLQNGAFFRKLLKSCPYTRPVRRWGGAVGSLAPPHRANIGRSGSPGLARGKAPRARMGHPALVAEQARNTGPSTAVVRLARTTFAQDDTFVFCGWICGGTGVRVLANQYRVCWSCAAFGALRSGRRFCFFADGFGWDARSGMTNVQNIFRASSVLTICAYSPSRLARDMAWTSAAGRGVPA